MRYRLVGSGATVDLSREKKIGEGGEARVYSVVAHGLAAKIYHCATGEHRRKLDAMLANPPHDPTAARGHVSIAWPRDLLVDARGEFAGYVMPLVPGMEPLIKYYVPKLRRQQRPLFDYLYLVTAALNVASALRALHERGYVVGDVNESNILLAETALATFVDTDSFQVPDPASGVVHRCLVGKPEFTPAELQDQDFRVVDRAPESDHFGLAVVLFQLLMEGTHPFDGLYSGPGEPPGLEARIAAGHFPHGNGAGLPISPKPFAPPFALLDPALQKLFLQCFGAGHGQPSARPDAAAWRGELSRARELLRTCPANEQHRHWGHVACPWCERARLLGGNDPFPSRQAVRQGQHRPQRSTGAPTPPSALRQPAPTPARPVPASPAPAPVRPPPVPAPRPGRIPRNLFVWGGAIAALVILFFVIRSPDKAVQPREFLDVPEIGKNFRVTAGLNMVWIAPGTFRMGSANGDSDEKPVHEVRLTTGYWLGESEVTQAQWEAIMGSNPSKFKGPNLPVENVSWDEAVAYCQKLTESERTAGRLPAGIEYRLPSEAQWEYACRAGTAGDYAGELAELAWYESNSGGKTHEVKTKQPNAWGLYDMHGNVWEWCADWHGEYAAALQTDPRGASSGANRVSRGGSWDSSGWSCRSAIRNRRLPGYRDHFLGFRLAAVPSAGSGATAPAVAGVERPGARDERRAEAVVEIAEGTKAGEEREIEIAQGVMITMCWVPAGSFTMGSPASEPDRSNDETQVQVRISRGYWLAKTECTQAQWRKVMGGNPSNFKGDTLPVEQVSWDDCQGFIKKLERPSGGWRFDLPSEAQWEYACRAGTGGAYAGELEAMAWHTGNSAGKTHPVGTKQPNAWGLQDMHGNVWEWCRDAYAAQLPGGSDPEMKSGAFRVSRGGSWFNSGRGCRSASRSRDYPLLRFHSLGFRLAAVPSSGL